MTIQEVINFVDLMKPNGFGNTEKTMWLNEVEGKIQTEVMLLSLDSVRKYVYSATYTAAGISFPDSKTMVCPSSTSLRPYGTITITGLTTYSANNITATINSVSADGKTLYFDDGTFSATGETGDAGTATLTYDGSGIELLVPAPHDKLYYTYLQAMIDFYNGEYDRYANAITLWNSFYDEYRKWYSYHINPASGNAFSMGYYISAYGIALKNGYVGTEEEWLLTLKGETPLIDAVLSDTSENAIQNKTVKGALDDKADLVEGATSGNFATLDVYGNIADSGYKPSDFEPDLTFDTTPTAGSSNPVTSNGVYDALALKANKAQEAWVTPTLLNSYISNSSYPVAYMKDEIGFVHLRGRIETGAPGSNAFLFPSGYRPSQVCGVVGMTAVGYDGRANIFTSGYFQPSTYNSYLYLDGITFRAEA